MIHMSRKAAVTSLFVFCAVLLAAAPAFAQGVAFQVSSLPQQARIEGTTETVGAVVVQATNAGTIKAGSSLTVLYSGTITNLSTSGSNIGILAVSGVALANFAVGPASGNQVTIQVNTDTTFAVGNYLVISEVRVNVNALGAGTTTVTATLSGTSSFPTTNPITFTNATVPVASIVSPSLSVAFTSATPLQTCAIPGGGKAFSIQVTERYPAALTILADEANFTPAGTGITAPTLGTSVVVTLSGVTSGLAIQAIGTSAASGTLALGAPSTLTQTSTGSALTFTFPVTADTTSLSETITINFVVGLPNGTGGAITPGGGGGSLPAIGTTAAITATVALGPVSSGAILNFAANTQGTGTIGTIGDCVTNILFPFLTNQVGFDTSVQIANTSSDKLAFPSGGASAQNGTCTLTFYPTDLTTQTATASGSVGTPSQVTTPTIAAGGTYAFQQSGTSFKGQSGYMFAVCRFLDAHAFSFVVNGSVSTGTISQGLLGLIIPNGTITANRVNPGTTFESLSH